MVAERLGILVNTNRHPDYVRELAAAAGKRRKRVHVHFCGDGLQLLGHPALATLERVATVSSGARRGSPDAGERTMALSDFFRICDRCIVF